MAYIIRGRVQGDTRQCSGYTSRLLWYAGTTDGSLNRWSRNIDEATRYATREAADKTAQTLRENYSCMFIGVEEVA